MSQEVKPARDWMNLWFAVYIVVPVLFLAVIVSLLIARSATTPGARTATGSTEEQRDTSLAQARKTLGRQSDLNSCRGMVALLNAHLAQLPDKDRPRWTSEEEQQAKKLLALDEGEDRGELAEANNALFTTLDAHHLASCMLLRDAAGVLEIAPLSIGTRVIKQEPLDRARAGFEWTMRQVRLQEPLLPGEREIAPPAHVLRRGHGSEGERALVFLALLEQFGLEEEAAELHGCLLFLPADKGMPRLWACGVAVGAKPKEIYLFDPRLGLPLPGPGGKGIATLAQAQSDPSVLAQLKSDKLTYDVTAEQAKKALCYLVCPLSAASARMRFLQDRLLRDATWQNTQLPAAVRVRLAENPTSQLATMQAALKASGSTATPAYLGEATRLLRSFLSRDEGGTDTGVQVPVRFLRGFTSTDDPLVARLPRRELFQLEAVPWPEFPAIFRNPGIFGFQSRLGQLLRDMFAAPFLKQINEPNSARDLILRGKFNSAVPDLVKEQAQWEQMRTRLREAPDLTPEVVKWVEEARPVFAAWQQAQGTPDAAAAQGKLMEFWRKTFMQGAPLEVFLFGAIARPRGAEATYQLGLCRHEQAERYQKRLDLAATAGQTLTSDLANARKTWIDTEGYWKEFLDANPIRPDQPPAPGLAQARRLRAMALTHLGQREEAVRLLRDLSAPMTDLEKLGARLLARQIETEKPR